MANEKKPKVKKEKAAAKAGLVAVVPAPAANAAKKAKKKKEKKVAQVVVEPPVDEILEQMQDLEEQEVPSSPEKEKNGDVSDWSAEDDNELFQRMSRALPRDDTMKYESRVNHMDWEMVAFNDHTADECKKRWAFVQGHLRRYRIVKELLEDAIVWRKRPWANFNRGTKSQKHPDYPKKPLTSYMLFYMDKKDQVLAKRPGLGMTELSKYIANIYHELDEAKKQKYADQATKEKEQYEIKLRKFLVDHPDYVPLKSEKGSSKGVPPKAPTPLKMFIDKKLPKYVEEGMSQTEAKEKCKDEYKLLPDKKKLKWILRAVEEEDQYNEDFEKFRLLHPDVEASAKKSILTKEEKNLKERHDGKPDKPPNSGYSMFSRDMLAGDTLKHLESKERMAEISRLWKLMDEPSRKAYNERVSQANNAYKLEYASYLDSLTQEQRDAELRQKGGKRTASGTASQDSTVPKKKAKAAGKKAAAAAAAASASSSEDSEADATAPSDDEDGDMSPPSGIQKPKSSLQMFCDSNMAKYKKKNAKMSQQELNRLMAKDFSNLPEDKKKIYTNMATEAKGEKVNTATEVKTEKPKKAATAAKVVIEAPVAPSPKVKAAPKVKPAAKAKATPAEKTAKTSQANNKALPEWIAKQGLYEGEPPKPPEKLAEYYVYYVLKDYSLSGDDVEARFNKLSEKQKKKHAEQHKKKQNDYVNEFGEFVRNLTPTMLKRFRNYMRERERDKNEGEEAADDDDDAEDDEGAEEDAERDDSSSEDEASDDDDSD